GIQQYRGMVVVDPRGGPAPQGSAVLSPARGKFGIRIRRLCLRTIPAAGRSRRAEPAFAGGRDLREGQGRRLSPAQSVAELAILARNKKGALPGRLLCLSNDAAASSLPDWRRAHPAPRGFCGLS